MTIARSNDGGILLDNNIKYTLNETEINNLNRISKAAEKLRNNSLTKAGVHMRRFTDE